jgi:transposase-like protein
MKIRRTGLMDISNFVKEYLVDQEDGLRAFLTFFLNSVMLFEATQQAGAAWYERTGTRTASRNGTKKRSLLSLKGRLTLDKPEFRDKPFKTVVFEKYSRSEPMASK